MSESTQPAAVVRAMASRAFELEILRHPNGKVASLKVHVGRSFGALILSFLALCRGHECGAAIRGLISLFGR